MKKIKFQEFKIISFLFFVINSYGQIEEPQYILASKFFSSNNSIAIVVRYDNGIDSISFPIDTNKDYGNGKSFYNRDDNEDSSDDSAEG